MNDDAKRAQEAIDKIIGRSLNNSKTSLINSKKVDNHSNNEFGKPTYINYKSSSLLEKPNKRIIKIVDKQVDPMLPPSFKIKKTPQGPPEKDLSGDMPILHDFEANDKKGKKVTSEDQKKWYIPPAVSNWKNTEGFAISIDKRMIGSGKEETTKINEKFSSLSEALDEADKQAREEIKMRIKLQKKLEREEIRKREETLSKLSKQSKGIKRERERESEQEDYNGNDNGMSEAARRREEIRNERRQRAERELNKGKFQLKSSITSKSTNNNVPLKKNENLYDSNLFINSSISNAKQSNDQLYTTPLFTAYDGLKDIYKSRNSEEGEEGEGEVGVSRGPVVFEKDTTSNTNDSKEYGLDK